MLFVVDRLRQARGRSLLGRRVLRIELEGLFIVGKRLVELVPAKIHGAAPLEAVRVARLQRDRGGKIVERQVVEAHQFVGQPAVVERVGAVGIERNHAREIGNRVGEAAEGRQRNAAIADRIHKFRVERDRLVQIPQGQFVFPLVAIGGRAIVMRNGLVGWRAGRRLNQRRAAGNPNIFVSASTPLPLLVASGGLGGKILRGAACRGCEGEKRATCEKPPAHRF